MNREFLGVFPGGSVFSLAIKGIALTGALEEKLSRLLGMRGWQVEDKDQGSPWLRRDTDTDTDTDTNTDATDTDAYSATTVAPIIVDTANAQLG